MLTPHLGAAKTILVSPDGLLNGLPFAALPGDTPGTYLIEDGYAFATVPVPQLLPQLMDRPTEPPAASLLAIGDVDYGTAATRDGEYKPLPGTGRELENLRQSVARRFAGSAVITLTKGEATKAAFAKQAPKHQFLHLATHGFFAKDSERSALGPENRARRTGRNARRSGGRGCQPRAAQRAGVRRGER